MTCPYHADFKVVIGKTVKVKFVNRRLPQLRAASKGVSALAHDMPPGKGSASWVGCNARSMR